MSDLFNRPEEPSYNMIARSQTRGGFSARYDKNGAQIGWNEGPNYYRQPWNQSMLDLNTAYFVEYDVNGDPTDICGCNGYDPWMERIALGLNGSPEVESQEDPAVVEEDKPYEPDEFVPDIMDITRGFCR